MNNAVNLTVDDTDYASGEIDCSQATKFLLMYDIAEFGTLVNNDRVRIRVEFREAGGTWREYMTGPFGAIWEEESTTPCNFTISGDCVGERMRVVLTSDYTNVDPTANYFIVTTQVTLITPT